MEPFKVICIVCSGLPSVAHVGYLADLVTFLGKLHADHAEYARALAEKYQVSKVACKPSVSHITSLVMYGTMMDIQARTDTIGEL